MVVEFPPCSIPEAELNSGCVPFASFSFHSTRHDFSFQARQRDVPAGGAEGTAGHSADEAHKNMRIRVGDPAEGDLKLPDLLM